MYIVLFKNISYNHVNKNTWTTFKNPLLQKHWTERFVPRASWGFYSTGRASPNHHIFHSLFQCVESCSQNKGGWGVRPPWKVSSFRKHPLLYNPVDISSKWFIKKSYIRFVNEVLLPYPQFTYTRERTTNYVLWILFRDITKVTI